MVLPVVTWGMIDAVGDPKALYPIDFQLPVHHRHGVLAHLGGAGLMPVAECGVPDEALKLGAP